MSVAKFEHPDLSEHQSEIFKQLAAFRKEGQLCDVVVKSRDGTQHCAHMAVLCAASVGFKNMLLGAFREADQVQQGQPVEIPASDAVVAALLKYIYGGQPSLDLEDSMELLSLADAYHLPQLALGLEKLLRVSLDSAPVGTALKLLQQRQCLHELKASCEEKIAAHFESCIEHEDFLNLTAGQVARILRREDLQVSREEVVVKGLFSWLKVAKERMAFLGVLLQNVDLHALSFTNLNHLRQLSASMGQHGHDLQQEVDEAWRMRRKRNAGSAGKEDRPLRKRRCLPMWSSYLGAHARGALRKVVPKAYSMCCHEGAIYTAEGASIVCWKPCDKVCHRQVVAGEGATVNGVNDLGSKCDVSVTPSGKIVVADTQADRLLTFENGCGQVVLSDLDGLQSIHCSPSGDLYVLTEGGGKVGKLVGATLQTLISNETLPPDLQFDAADVFVSKDDVVYISDYGRPRILRITPSEGALAVIGESPCENSQLAGLHVTDGGKIFVADKGRGVVWAFDPGDATWNRVLQCPPGIAPLEVMLHGSSLYINTFEGSEVKGVMELELPAELQLE